MTDKPTLDTNILIYAFGQKDDNRKHIAKEIITNCNIVSLQVVNETVYVLLKKFKFGLYQVDPIVLFIKQKFVISDLNIHISEYTLKITALYGYSFWDSMIIASALYNNCSVLYSEDLQHNQIIEGQLRIINPFKELI